MPFFPARFRGARRTALVASLPPALTGHFDETLAKFKVGERERNELVAIVQSLRGDIVNRP